MENKIEEAILKTIMFWSDKIRKPMNQDNGDDSSTGGFISILMNSVSLQAQQTITDEKIVIFENKLFEILKEKYNSKNNAYSLSLNVDYHPCQELYEAATFAGINPACFPCKSSTYIDDKFNAFGKYQYGAPNIKL